MLRYTYPFYILLLTVSCQSPVKAPPDIISILEKKSSNKNELGKLIRHYSSSPADSLKLQAAFFLIRQADGLLTLDTNSIADNDVYFEALGNLWSRYNRAPSSYDVSFVVDSINKTKKFIPAQRQAKFVPELSQLTARMLIDNIDHSFSVWNSYPYAKNTSFANFCEYILPYRASDAFREGMKHFFQNKYQQRFQHADTTAVVEDVADSLLTETYSGFREEFNLFKANQFLLPLKFTSLINGRVAECRDMNALRVNVLRSFGIPSAVDGIPGWGNTGGKHFWYAIIGQHKKDSILPNNDETGDQNRIGVAFTKNKVDPQKLDLPENVDLYHTKFLPKVFRECFSKQPTSLAAINKDDLPLPEYFRSDRLLDVTDKYVQCANIAIPLKKTEGKKNPYVYLCTFDNTDWNIVAWGTVKDSVAQFSNVGVNICYLPVWYDEGSITPAGDPFILQTDGQIQNIIPDLSVKQTHTYPLKWPYRTHIVFYASRSLGVRFQLANKPDFSDSVTVHTIQKIPFYGQEIAVKQSGKYRYLIMQFAGLSTVHMAELAFYGTGNNGQPVKLTGTLMGNKGIVSDNVADLFDNDMLSYFSAEKKDSSFVAIDLGENNAAHITHIWYMPRNDDNVISKEKKYSLYCWNNGWQWLGEKAPQEDKKLVFEQVPRNALLLLKDNRGGVENRIFTYTNNKQNFW